MPNPKSIALLSRDHLDLELYRKIKALLVQEFPDLNVFIFSGERNEARINALEDANDIIYLYKDYSQFQALNKNLSDVELTQLAGAQSHIIDGAIYKSEKRYIEKTISERELQLEQIYMVDFIKNWIAKNPINMIFMTDGATISRTATLSVCEYMEIPYFRMFPAGWLNLKTGQRYFFADNNFRTLSDDVKNHFNYDKEFVHDFANQFLNRIKDDLFQLDTRALKMKKVYFNTDWKDLARFFRDALYSFKQEYRIRLFKTIRPIWNRFFNRRKSIHQNDLVSPYFLFPLNWPDDAQLTLRAPHYRDVLSIVEQIANVLPYGFTLAIKEHPAWPGYIDSDRMKACLRFHKNVVLLRSEARMQDLLKKSSGLITLNSTAAVEALLVNKPVMCLAHAFYRGTGLTFDVNSAGDISKTISKMLQYNRSSEETFKLLLKVMSKFYFQTVPAPGEVSTAETVHEILANGIKEKLKNFNIV